MKKISSKIVFFGSGPVAAKSLVLLQKHQVVEAVITKPSTLQEMQAVALNSPLFTVSTKKELDQLIDAETFESHLGILIDFGIIVSKKVIDSFNLGIVNSHFSLLPQWRGADPITFAILSGQYETGVSLMVIDEGMDTGKIIAQKSVKIYPGTTTPQLTNSLIDLSDQLLTDYLPGYTSGELKPKAQTQPERVTYSRKLTKEDGVLDFNKPAVQLEREIRAFIEWPKSRTEIAGKDVIITSARSVSTTAPNNKPGDITTDTENGIILIATSHGSLSVETLKPAGKKEMSAKAFLLGYVK